MCNRKFRTYNFYKKDEQYYIIQNNQHIEVSVEVFNAYKMSTYAQDYNDRYYHVHNFSLENNSNTVDKEFISLQHSEIEESYLIEEYNQEFLLQFSPKVRQTIILWLEGYNDTEVAKKTDFSCRYVRKIRAQLRKMLE